MGTSYGWESEGKGGVGDSLEETAEEKWKLLILLRRRFKKNLGRTEVVQTRNITEMSKEEEDWGEAFKSD